MIRSPRSTMALAAPVVNAVGTAYFKTSPITLSSHLK
jgi:hypothetical protein